VTHFVQSQSEVEVFVTNLINLIETESEKLGIQNLIKIEHQSKPSQCYLENQIKLLLQTIYIIAKKQSQQV
jgi:hypothetical protein